MNYYAAKFKRESKDKPTEWVIVGAPPHCRVERIVTDSKSQAAVAQPRKR